MTSGSTLLSRSGVQPVSAENDAAASKAANTGTSRHRLEFIACTVGRARRKYRKSAESSCVIIFLVSGGYDLTLDRLRRNGGNGRQERNERQSGGPVGLC